MLDKTGLLYWYGGREGLFFFRKTQHGEIDAQWRISNEFIDIIETSISPNGEYIVFIYPSYANNPSRDKWSLGMLVTRNAQLDNLSIPPLSISVPISVRLAQ